MKLTDLLVRLWPQVRPYRRLVVLAAILSLLGGLVGAPTPLLMRAIVDTGVPKADRQLIAVLVLGIIAIGVARQIISHYSIITSNRLQEVTTLGLQQRLIEHLLHLPACYHARVPVGSSASLIANDARRASSVLPSLLVGAVTNVTKLTFGVIVLCHLSLKLTGLTLLMLPFGAVIFLTFGRRARRLSVEQQAQTARVFGHVYETVAGVETVRTLGIHRRVLLTAFGSLKRLYHTQVRCLRANSTANGLSTVVVSAVTGSVLYVGASDVAAGDLTLGTYFAFNAYAAYLFGPALGLMGTYVSIQGSVGAILEVLRVLDQPLETAVAVPKRVDKLDGEIVFNRVCASYSDRLVIDEATFTIPAGARVGLVGRSGAGKSTILRLVAGIIMPTEGHVTVGGMDTREHNLHCLRANIAYVPQDVHIFSGTMRDNIRLGRLDSTDKEIDALVNRLGICGIVERLDRGIDTVVGVNGAGLSGGERQLIGIGRAMLRDAPVVLLDESTASLDTHTDAAIAHALRELADGRTVLAIAHRLSTLRHVESVLYMDGGRVIGMGPHATLCRTIIPYRVLCAEYLRMPGSDAKAIHVSLPPHVLTGS